MVTTDELLSRLQVSIDKYFEWLVVYPEGRSFPLQANEIEIKDTGGRVVIGVPGEKGFRSWRVLQVDVEGEEVFIDVAGAFGSERSSIRLIPRTPAAELAKNIELARSVRANEIAALVPAGLPGFRVVRVAFNEGNGRIATYTLENENKRQSTAISDVTNSLSPEALLSTAILWFERSNARRKKPFEDVWIIAEKRRSRPLRKLHTLLERGAKARVRIAEIADEKGDLKLKELDPQTVNSLWREKPKRLALPAEVKTSGIGEMIAEIAPEKIDLIRSKQGETLRFHGLPFARVRTMLGKEKAWFGVDKNRKVLDGANFRDVESLVEELERFRSAESQNPRHEYYRTSPESWLESILRRNIKLLDANVELSPIYNQFRTLSDKIDLLALRKDGRLVIIELKTSPDREMVFQAADYWRKIELHRRRGHIRDARLFGDREILDKPALVYAVAPALSFHRRFDPFAKMLVPEIELWRFDLHEDWRREIKVIARINHSLERKT